MGGYTIVLYPHPSALWPEDKTGFIRPASGFIRPLRATGRYLLFIGQAGRLEGARPRTYKRLDCR